MTEQEINRAIAEICTHELIQCSCGGHLCKNPKAARNYFNDLNACREMEASCKFGDSLEYEGHLDRLTRSDGLRIWHATSQQRCEAFLRTFNKWKEDAEKETK